MMKNITLIILSLLFFPGLQAQQAPTLPAGEGMFVYDQYAPFADRPLEIHYYIPVHGERENMPIIFVFQGADRNYTYLLDAWKEEAEKRKFMVFVPQFEKEDYPLCDYQEVGVMDQQHTNYRKPEELTPVLIDKIFEYVRQCTGSQRDTYNIYGHSAGGQFVQRFMLFHDSPYVERAIIGSPGWYTFPDTTLTYSYGVKDVPYMNEERLRNYLQKDIILQLGTGDTLRESYLRKTPEAEAQGRNRYERGNRFYDYIRKLAAQHHWSCRWRKVEVQGIGHLSVEMGMAAIPLLLQESPQQHHTPSLSRKDSCMATLTNMYQYLQTLTKLYPGKAHLSSVGKTPEGLELPILYFGNGKDTQKIKIWIQSGLHGNEPAGPEVVCMLASYLMQSPEGAEWLKQADIALLPIANPYGYSVQSRYSGGGLDLNRDQTKLADPVSVLLKKTYAKWDPEIALDIHEYRPTRPEYATLDDGQPAESDYDVLFLASGHPNIADTLREMTIRLFQPKVQQALAQQGYSSGFYFTPRLINDFLYIVKDGKSPQSSSTWQGLANAVSLFMEIKGIGMGKDLLDKRTDCGFIAVQNILRTACNQRKAIKAGVAQAIKETLRADRPITVTFDASTRQYPIRFIGTHTGRRFTKNLTALDALYPQPTLTRERPKAYLLRADCQEVAAKLRIFGIQMDTLTTPLTCLTEKYIVEHYQQANHLWEQIHPVTVCTRLVNEVRTIPTGSIIVPLHQKAGNLIVSLLEPESANGFVSFGVIDTGLNQTLPYYRIIDILPPDSPK